MLSLARRYALRLRERRGWLPTALLLTALAALIPLGGDRSHFYRPTSHTWDSVKNLQLAENLSPSRGFRLLIGERVNSDNSIEPVMYGRFPIGGPALIKLATMPFEGSLSAKILAARALALAFFGAAAVAAYIALARVVRSRWAALAATLLAFSSYYALYFSDHISNETNMDMFGAALTFHGMIVFAQEGRFRQLAVKTCAALLLGWHVYALILPFIAAGFGGAAIDRLRPLFRRGGDASVASVGTVVRATLGTALRSRHIALGLIALAFGGALLGFNLANEYAAHGGDKPFSELRTVKSILERTDLGAPPISIYEDAFDWDNVLGRTLVRLGGAFFPYALTEWGRDFGLFAFPESHLYAASAVVLGGLAAVGCVGALALAPARGYRAALAALAAMPFCWGLPMRGNATLHQHDYEAALYFGAPLVAFALALAWARNRRGEWTAAAVAIIAIPVFLMSAFQVGALYREPGHAEFHKAMIADFDRIREIARGKTVSIDPSFIMRTMQSDPPFRLHWALYYLSGSPTAFARGEDATDRRTDFLVSMYRDSGGDIPTLTPGNELAFLYAGVSGAELYAARYDSLASERPEARSDFDLYLRDNTLSYLKEPCAPADVERPFFLNVFPADADDLSPAREFDDFVFGFNEGGKTFGGKCMINAPLPAYPIASVRTGQLIVGEGTAWDAKFFAPTYMPEILRTARASQPVAQSGFDIYIDGGTLIYLKDPCAESDARGRFFLSVHPANPKDLPENRRETGHGSDNFAFASYGTMVDGACVIVRQLPDYPIAKIETGQWIPGGARLWDAAIRVGE